MRGGGEGLQMEGRGQGDLHGDLPAGVLVLLGKPICTCVGGFWANLLAGVLILF